MSLSRFERGYNEDILYIPPIEAQARAGLALIVSPMITLWQYAARISTSIHSYGLSLAKDSTNMIKHMKMANYKFLIASMMIQSVHSANWIGLIPQYDIRFAYGEYYGTDPNTCIVTENGPLPVVGLPINTPSIKECTSYEVSPKRISLPRNVMPICGYEPNWYGINARLYTVLVKTGFGLGNSTYEERKKQCLQELSVSSKARFTEMYGLNVHETACVRYGEHTTAAYGLDPSIQQIVKSIESNISDKIQWQNITFLANLLLATGCVAINKNSCISLWSHLLQERDSSFLNLLGFAVDAKPTTWLYADGLDIQIFHIMAEIIGLEVETQLHEGIYYYHVLPNAASKPFSPLKPGLIGGKL